MYLHLFHLFLLVILKFQSLPLSRCITLSCDAVVEHISEMLSTTDSSKVLVSSCLFCAVRQCSGCPVAGIVSADNLPLIGH